MEVKEQVIWVPVGREHEDASLLRLNELRALRTIARVLTCLRDSYVSFLCSKNLT